MKKWIILFVAFLLAGCAGNTNHITYTINDEYELIRTSGNAFELFPTQDAVYATQYIPAKITDIAWDDKYIIAKQTEEKSIRIILTQQLQIKSEHYWIIDVKHNKRFGYNEKQFHEQKMLLKLKFLSKV